MGVKTNERGGIYLVRYVSGIYQWDIAVHTESVQNGSMCMSIAWEWNRQICKRVNRWQK